MYLIGRIPGNVYNPVEYSMRMVRGASGGALRLTWTLYRTLWRANVSSENSPERMLFPDAFLSSSGGGLGSERK